MCTGKEGKSTLVLEAICDHHTFFWHASYGYAGTMNDLNILNFSPLLERLLDGSFEEIESGCKRIPFMVGDQEFCQTFILVDGVYPPYSRFVKGITQPITEEERKFTRWQEKSRKDIERGFGIFKGCWQYAANPIYALSLKVISKTILTCLILHNILTADRVMGDMSKQYDPSFLLDVEGEDGNDVDQSDEMYEMQMESVHNIANEDSIAEGFVQDVHDFANNRDRWIRLSNRNEFNRLSIALRKVLGNEPSNI